jgi:hypothetical protein
MEHRMSISPSLQQADVAQFPIRHNDHLVGLLIEDSRKDERRERYPIYRFTALDKHFMLLDGSRFTAPHRAYAAVARLGRFVGRPPAANEA